MFRTSGLKRCIALLVYAYKLLYRIYLCEQCAKDSMISIPLHCGFGRRYHTYTPVVKSARAGRVQSGHDLSLHFQGRFWHHARLPLRDLARLLKPVAVIWRSCWWPYKDIMTYVTNTHFQFGPSNAEHADIEPGKIHLAGYVVNSRMQ